MHPEEIVFDSPLAPSYPLQPPPHPYDKPKYGVDWTGIKPFQAGVLLHACVECMHRLVCFSDSAYTPKSMLAHIKFAGSFWLHIRSISTSARCYAALCHLAAIQLQHEKKGDLETLHCSSTTFGLLLSETLG